MYPSFDRGKMLTAQCVTPSFFLTETKKTKNMTRIALHNGSQEGWLFFEAEFYEASPADIAKNVKFLIGRYGLSFGKYQLTEYSFTCIIDSYADELPRGFFITFRDFFQILSD